MTQGVIKMCHISTVVKIICIYFLIIENCTNVCMPWWYTNDKVLCAQNLHTTKETTPDTTRSI